MHHEWKARRTRTQSAPGAGQRFVPGLLALEDRSVPSTFYIDPALAGSNDGDTVTFNAGDPSPVGGLRYASSAAFYQSDVATHPNATYAFSDLRQAIDATELNPGPDTVRIARSQAPIPLDNAAVTTPVTGGTVNSVNITQPLTLIGSGLGASIITPTTDTLFDDGTGAVADKFTSVFRVSNAGNSGASLTASDLTLDGGGKQLGIGFSIQNGAAGAFTRVDVRNVIFDPAGASEGIAVLGFAATSLTFADGSVEGYGRVGIQFGNTPGSVTNSIVTGRGSATFYNSGIDIYGNSTVLISGSTVTGNLGRTGNADSSGVLAYADPDDLTRVPTVTLIGNTISGNDYGIARGLPGPDEATSITAQYNNITGNNFGAFNQVGGAAIQAPNNWWGSPTGPFNANTNSGGQGNAVTDQVVYNPPLPTPTPVRVATTTADYLNQITLIGATIAPQAGQPNPVLNGAPVRFTVTFAQPVTGFDASDVVVTSSTGGTPTVAVSGSGTTYTVTVTNLAGSGGTVTARVVDRAATTSDGFLTTASGTASAAFSSTVILGTSLTAAGPDAGGGSVVAVIGPDGAVQKTVNGIDQAIGTGARPVVGDFNGDGVLDVAVGTGPGVVTQVRIFDGATNQQLFLTQPFESAFTGGVFVAAGDIDGDGKADLVVTPDQGGGPRVLIYHGGDFAQAANFFGITGDPNFRGGARPAVGDVNGDGKADVAVAAGFLGGPRVAVFSGATVFSGSPAKLFNDQFVFEDTLRNGAFVAIGDLDGDGKGDLISGAGPGGAPRVFALSGADLLNGLGVDGSRVLANFFGGDMSNRQGIRVAAKNLDNDNKADIVVSPGPGVPGRVTAYAGAALPLSSPPAVLWQADPFPGFTGGVFVG